MASVNKVILIGNLTRHPEKHHTRSGKVVCEFGLAVNERWGSGEDAREETVFVDVTCFGKTAELADQYLYKGDPAFIEGKLRLEKWEDRETKKPRTKLSVVAVAIQFLGKPKREKAPPPDLA